MLIINADDWGLNELATDNCLACYKNGSITSASAMMFMADTERSAELALESGLDMGLHLNFTEKFNGYVKSSVLNEYQQRIAAFLLKNKYCTLLYNPLLKRSFDYVYKAQYEEYIRLYKRIPTHIDGHHHMHLCMNVLINKVIPKGFKVRRNFSFAPGEKNPFNRFYRSFIDMRLMRRYVCTDFFYSILPIQYKRLQKITNLAKSSNIELMVHPENAEEHNYLMSEECLWMISDVKKGTYVNL